MTDKTTPPRAEHLANAPEFRHRPAGSPVHALHDELINILLVDDEPKNLTVLETLLNDPTYRLVRAESANEALLALVVEEFALLILDIRMPGMTGFELAQMIKDRKKTAQVPIIFLSAYYNEDQHVLEGYNTGAVDYLHKPVNPTILRSKVAVFAELHRKNRESVLASRALLAEITERRRAEEQLRELNENLEQRVTERTDALRESEARLAAALEGGGMGLWEWDLRSDRSVWNAIEYQLLGLPAGDGNVQVRQFFDRIYPADVDSFNQMLADLMRNGGDFHHEVRINRADTGEVRWLAAAGHLSRDANGQGIKLVGVNYDVTERRRVESSLRRSQEQYHTLFSTLLEGFCIIKMLFDDAGVPIDYRFLEVNPAFATQTGLENVQGKRMRELVPEHDGHWFETYGKVALTGQPVRFVQEAKAMNRWFDASAYRVGEAEDRQVAVLLTDITDQKRVEEELKASKARAEIAMGEAEHANRAKDHFLAVLSHELRTPLMPVRMAVSLWERQEGLLPVELQRDLAMIRRNVDLECRLIDDLLDLNRIIRGKLELQLTPVDLHEEISHALRIIEWEASMKQVALSFDAGAVDAHIVADAARLQQVLWNLLKNAVKFTPAAGSVAVRTYNKPQGRVCVEVRDTGAGIEPAALEQIFNAFEQGGAHVTRQFGGMGLGLTISRAIATVHGGKLTAQSEGQGRGAAFTLELAFVALPETSSACRVSQTPVDLQRSSENRRDNLQILLVEDHVDTSRLLTRLLNSKGFEVKTAGTVNEALSIAEGHVFDLVISDLGLPDGTGYDLIRQLAAQRPTRAVALSGYGMEEDVQLSRDAGFSMHLTKPVNLEQLELCIRTMLDNGTDAQMPTPSHYS